MNMNYIYLSDYCDQSNYAKLLLTESYQLTQQSKLAHSMTPSHTHCVHRQALTPGAISAFPSCVRNTTSHRRRWSLWSLNLEGFPVRITPYPSGTRLDFTQWTICSGTWRPATDSVTAFHLNVAVLHAEDEHEACDL